MSNRLAGFAGIYPRTPCMRVRARYTGEQDKSPQTPQTCLRYAPLEPATSRDVGDVTPAEASK